MIEGILLVAAVVFFMPLIIAVAGRLIQWLMALVIIVGGVAMIPISANAGMPIVGWVACGFVISALVWIVDGRENYNRERKEIERARKSKVSQSKNRI